MGRRKIEIRAIKDDRNRSVTFLKRKGGLFKKAHELSVLCSVDVAVIIFGQNKKLYEFSSGDIHQTLNRYQYYGAPHEHKGPGDFADKAGGDDDDDEEMDGGSPGPQEMGSPPHHGVPQHHNLQPQPGFQHMRHQSHPSASASPPVPNGGFQQHRLSTPQPASRPPSRTHNRRQSSNLVPQDHPHPQASQPSHQNMGYSYQPNQQQYYQPHNAHSQPQHTPPMQQHQQFSHPPPNAQMQQMYLQDQRRASLPPNMPMHTQQEQNQRLQSIHTPPQPSRPFQSPPLPEPAQPMQHQHQHQHQNQHQRPQGLGLMEDHRAPPRWEQQGRNEPQYQPHNQQSYNREGGDPRSVSIDSGMAMRNTPSAPPAPQRYGPPAPRPVARTSSTSAVSEMHAPSRVGSMQSDAKRPRLTVQIPGEASDAGSGDADSSSPKENIKANMTPPTKAGAAESGHSSGIVLPAPSPRSASAGAILSAGATGPTNPFARPNPPSFGNGARINTDYKDGIASPMSALPSRVMGDSDYMSSPSSMFPGLGFGSMNSNTLASPAVYQPTPINTLGPSFRDDPLEKRRKSTEDDDKGPNKKQKP